MKAEPIVYTYDNDKGKPVVTVYLQKHRKNYARGMSIRSKKDFHKETVALHKAEGRAKKAIKRKNHELPINRDEAVRLLFETSAPPFKFKAEYPAQLTPFEEGLIEEVI